MTVLDLSGYDLSTIDAACMKASGVSGVILGVFSGSNSPHGMADAGEALQKAGIPILGWYGLVYFGSAYGSTRDITWAAQLAKDFKTPRVWIDCEIDAYQVGFTDTTPCTPASRILEIKDNISIVEMAGKEAGIYSAPWWWIPNTGNYKGFSDRPLWFANYGPGGAPQVPLEILPQTFGGWTKATVHQYTSILNICGRGRDANYVFEEDMTTDEVKTIVDGRLDATLGLTLLALLEQVTGIANSTFSPAERKRADAVLARLVSSGIAPHVHQQSGTTGPVVKA